MCGIGSDWTSVYPNIKQSLTAPTTTQQSFSKIKTSIQSSTIQPSLTNLPVSSTNLPVSSTNLPVSTTNLPVSSTSQSVSSTDLSVSSTINLSNLPSAAPINAGAKLGVCNGGFSVYPNTNISICNKDSLGSTRQASEVSLMFLII